MGDLKSIAEGLKQESDALIDALRSTKAREVIDRVGQLSDQQFIDIAALTAQICDTPFAAVSLIDDTTSYFKGIVPEVPMTCMDRNTVICNILTKTPDQELVIYDTEADERVCGLPFVNGTYDYLRFYAGLPLTTKEGHAIGTICVLDRVPRKIRLDQMAAMDRLRRIALNLMGER